MRKSVAAVSAVVVLSAGFLGACGDSGSSSTVTKTVTVPTGKLGAAVPAPSFTPAGGTYSGDTVPNGGIVAKSISITYVATGTTKNGHLTELKLAGSPTFVGSRSVANGAFGYYVSYSQDVDGRWVDENTIEGTVTYYSKSGGQPLVLTFAARRFAT
jgi:hypothetical protein